MPSRKNIKRINLIIEKIYKELNKRPGILYWFLSILPFIGKIVKGRRARQRLLRDLRNLGFLVEAFELGYVPGGIDGQPIEWQNVTLINFFEKFNPLNQNYLAELATSIKDAFTSPIIWKKGKKISEYSVGFTVDSILQIEGIAASMKNTPRQLLFGNPEMKYWLDWTEEIRNCIEKKLHSSL